jgi:outer membrane receptor protein involved in Fe transport
LYGQGDAGEFGYEDGQGGGLDGTDGLDQSWGPRLNGQLIPQFDSPVVNGVRQPTPWIAHPDNVSGFFNTGTTFSNSVAFSGGSDVASGRLSFGADQTKGIIPNNNLSKFTGSLNGDLKVSSRLKASASIQYGRNAGYNRPGSGYTTSTLEQFVWFGRQVDVAELKDKLYNDDGSLYNWNSNYHNNPYWVAEENPEKDSRDRVIAAGDLIYQMTSWLNATLRSGTDFYRQNINQNWGAGMLDQSVGQFAINPSYAGGFAYTHALNNENNTELLFTANKQANSHLQFNATVGAARHYATFHRDNQQTPGITTPGIYNVSNAAIAPTLGQFDEAQQINSGYGSASFTLNNYWTVEATGRNDWSSTLPKGNNSYFYPSVNTSLVLTDLFPVLKNRFISYLKIRGSVAQVGASADPYQLATTYTGYSTQFGSLPLFSLGDALSNAHLKPEKTQSGEAGVELGLLNNRITFDGTIYDKATTNQIINLAVSNTTGFSSIVANAGKISNHGFEALVTVIPIRTASGLEWTSTFNYARNRSKVDALASGLQTIVIGTSQDGVNVEARVGEPYGSFFGNALLRDSATHELLLKNGLPQQDPVRRVLGNINPDWTGGWNNEVRFKRLTVSALLDIHRGGNINSITNYYGTGAGVLASSLLGRETDFDSPGVLVKGIDQATHQENTTRVSSEAYWQQFSFNASIDEPFIYDDSWVRLKELRVGLDLPRSFAQIFRSQSVNVAFIGRNLWLSSKVPNIDPEVSYQLGNNQGSEFAVIPQTRSFGINLRITP